MIVCIGLTLLALYWARHCLHRHRDQCHARLLAQRDRTVRGADRDFRYCRNADFAGDSTVHIRRLSAQRKPRAALGWFRLTAALFGWMPGGLVTRLYCGLRVFYRLYRSIRGHDRGPRRRVCIRLCYRRVIQEKFGLGLVTSAGSLGLLLFAPSLPLILYGIVAEVPVDDLFLAGILPGLVHDACAWAAMRSGSTGQTGKPMSEFETSGELVAAVKATAWEIPSAAGRAGWNLQRLLRRVRGGCGNGRVCPRSSRSFVLRDVDWRTIAGNRPRIDDTGRRHIC